MTWIESPLPDPNVWPTEGGEDNMPLPPDLYTGFIAYCPNRHQYWERVSSPAKCPECRYAMNHTLASISARGRFYIRETLAGRRVRWINKYLKENIRGQEEEVQV